VNPNNINAYLPASTTCVKLKVIPARMIPNFKIIFELQSIPSAKPLYFVIIGFNNIPNNKAIKALPIKSTGSILFINIATVAIPKLKIIPGINLLNLDIFLHLTPFFLFSLKNAPYRALNVIVL